MNVRQVNGSLQSYFKLRTRNWSLSGIEEAEGGLQFYGYGEGLPIGPTPPRNFTEMSSLSVTYAFRLHVVWDNVNHLSSGGSTMLKTSLVSVS
jgi:hypothetical protein